MHVRSDLQWDPVRALFRKPGASENAVGGFWPVAGLQPSLLEVSLIQAALDDKAHILLLSVKVFLRARSLAFGGFAALIQEHACHPASLVMWIFLLEDTHTA